VIGASVNEYRRRFRVLDVKFPVFLNSKLKSQIFRFPLFEASTLSNCN